MPEEGHLGVQAPGSSQAGSGSVHPRCVCVPACPFRRDFASAGRSPKAVPEKRVAARSSEGNSSASQVLRASSSEWNSSASQSRRTHSSEGNNGREANSSASQSRLPSSCPIRPACQQLPRASCAQQVPMCAGGPCRDCWSSFSLHPAQHRNYHPSGGSCT